MDHINRIDDHGDTYSIPYDPASRKKHPHEALFENIPTTMSKGPDGLWMPSAGAIFMPHTAARIAEHVELCGFRFDESAAQIRCVDLARGSRRWQDARAPIPKVDPVDSVHTVASAALTPGEKGALIERLQQDLDK